MDIFLYVLIGITIVNGQGTTFSDLPCEELVEMVNNVTEGKAVQLNFITTQPRQIVWQKEVNSTYNDIIENKNVYVIQSLLNNTEHQLYVYGKYSDSGNYRVKCGSTFSKAVYVYIAPLQPSVPMFVGGTEIYDCKYCLPGRIGKVVRVTCFADGGSEPINFTMYKDGQIITQDLETNQTSVNGTKRRTATYTFTPFYRMDTVFKCGVKNPAVADELSAVITVYIFLPPTRMEITVASVRENQSSEIQCGIFGGRPPLQPKFLIGGYTHNSTSKIKVTSTGNYTVTSSLARSFSRYENNVPLLCCVDVLDNITCNESQISVLFPPVEINLTEERNHKENGDTQLTLKCRVGASNPRVKVDWKGVEDIQGAQMEEMLTEDNRTRSSASTVTMLFNLTRGHNGREIKCSAVNQEFPNMEVSYIYKANITYSPIINVRGGINRTAYVGDDVELKCDVDGNPYPRISWHNESSRIKETVGKSITLFLRNISMEDAQTYKCVANNNIGGLQTQHVTLTVEDAFKKPMAEHDPTKSDSALIGSVLGGAAAIVGAVVACAAILTVRKKRREHLKQRAQSEGKRKSAIQIVKKKSDEETATVGHGSVYSQVDKSGRRMSVERQPEYASASSKAERNEQNCDSLKAKATQNVSKHSDTKVEGQLIYAELDLAAPSTRKHVIQQHEATEYVSIDFSKTGKDSSAEYSNTVEIGKLNT